MADRMKPAYLIAGDDGAKLDQTLSRLRARAEREGGAGSLETFGPGVGGAPDVEALVASMPAISLMATHRYLLADGVDRWRAPQVRRIAEALGSPIDDLTVVLVARGKVPKGLAEAVEKAGGEVLSYVAPGKRNLPGWVAEAARQRGLRLSRDAARALVARVGEGTVRLGTELDRIALWAEQGEELGVEEIEELTADSSERAGWTLGDAIVARDPREAVLAADALIEQGEAVTPLIYGMATRLRSAHLAAVGLEQGRPAKQIETSLPMAPYAAKMILRSVAGVAPAELADALGRIADLEWWTRGGSDYEERLAMTLAVREAAGAPRGD
jgi:DNA polymerase III subunit delta